MSIFVVGVRQNKRYHTLVHKQLFQMHDCVYKHVIRCTKKRVTRFIILEALSFDSVE